MYITQIFRYAPALVAPALAIVLISVVVSILSSLTQIKVSRQVMEKGSKENGLSYALITGIQKIKLAGAEKRAFARWAHQYADAVELSYNPPLLIKVNTAITSAISLAGTIVLYYLAVKTRVKVAKVRVRAVKVKVKAAKARVRVAKATSILAAIIPSPMILTVVHSRMVHRHPIPVMLM